MYRLTGTCAGCAARIAELWAQNEPSVQVDLRDFTFELPAGVTLEGLLAQGRAVEPGMGIKRVRRFSLNWGLCPGVLLLALGWGLHRYPTVSFILGAVSWLLAGAPVLVAAFGHLGRGLWRDEYFLMALATIGALCLGDALEAAAVMVFYGLGQWVESRAVARGRGALQRLTALRPAKARLRRDDGTEVEVSLADVRCGDLLAVRPGERFPVDGLAVEGESSADTACMTGESLPQRLKKGSEIVSGTVNLSSPIVYRASGRYDQSALYQLLQLVGRGAEQKAPYERFVTRFSYRYTPAVVIAAAVLALSPLVHGGPWGIWVHRALVFLVLSCPCALLISVPLTVASGLGAAARHGLAVKGGQALERLSTVKAVAFDKTGTLTTGRMTLGRCTVPEEVLPLLIGLEAQSNHPLALALRAAYPQVDPEEAVDVEEVPGCGLTGRTRDGIRLAAGNKTLMERLGLEVEDEDAALHFAFDGRLVGQAWFEDPIKADAASAVESLKRQGVEHLALFSGDSSARVRHVATALGLTEVRGGLLPAEKVEAVKKLRRYGPVLFVGDGINDGPALACADVGAAMGGLGSDAAVDAADMAVMNDRPGTLPLGIQIARHTLRTCRLLVFFVLIVKGAVALLDLWGWAPMWLAVFADVGVTVLAVFYASALLRYCPEGHRSDCICEKSI